MSSSNALKLPPVPTNRALFSRGLVLVAGAAGLGKSTMLAACDARPPQQMGMHSLSRDTLAKVVQGKIDLSQAGVACGWSGG